MSGSRKVKLEHFKNLIAVACADGHIDDEEKAFLREKAEELDLPEHEIDSLLLQAGELQFEVPLNAEDREDQLTDIVYLSMIDGEVHQKEYDLCVTIAHKLGLTAKDVDDVIALTRKLWKK